MVAVRRRRSARFSVMRSGRKTVFAHPSAPGSPLVSLASASRRTFPSFAVNQPVRLISNRDPAGHQRGLGPNLIEPTQQRFEEALALLKSRIEDHYGINVRSVDVAAPFSGDLDGQEIRLDPEFGVELMVFNLVHLFGHTVQWN